MVVFNSSGWMTVIAFGMTVVPTIAFMLYLWLGDSTRPKKTVTMDRLIHLSRSLPTLISCGNHHCRTVNPHRARYCRRCGHQLQGPIDVSVD